VSDKPNYNNRGQEDASEGKYNPPHSGIIHAIDRNVREVVGDSQGVAKREREDRAAYDKGWRHTKDQK
jgi:hypothetical protein